VFLQFTVFLYTQKEGSAYCAKISERGWFVFSFDTANVEYGHFGPRSVFVRYVVGKLYLFSFDSILFISKVTLRVTSASCVVTKSCR